MKNMRKLATLLLALVMLFTLAVSASAYTLTINNDSSGYTYGAYQIFKGELSEDGDHLSNIDWGTGVQITKDETNLIDAIKAIKVGDTEPFKDCENAEAVAEVLGKDNTKDNATAQAFADVVGQFLSTTTSGTVDAYDSTNKRYTISGLEAGYYLVQNTAVPEGNDTVYTRFILEVVKDATAIHKGSVPDVVKTIVEGGQNLSNNEASIGDTINYRWDATLPSNIADYDTYYYVFNDTLSKGLTLTDKDTETAGIQTDVTVKIVNGTTENDVTKYFYISATKNQDETTSLKVGIQDLLALENLTTPVTIDKDTKVVVTYTAVLNDAANVQTGEKNEVDLTYSNDPNNDGTGGSTPDDTPDEPKPTTPVGKTPKSEVTTSTTELIIKKVDQDEKVLTGAAFKITGDSVNVVVTTGEVYVESESGTYYKLKDGTFTQTAYSEELADKYESNKKYEKKTQVTIAKDEENKVDVEGFVDSTGTLKFTGLGVGTYTITETVTPDGYNTVEPTTVTISWNATTGFSYNGTDEVETNGVKTNTNQLTIINRAGSTLPSTGGVGTTLFYVIGSVLVLAAVVLLVTKKRMSSVQ